MSATLLELRTQVRENLGQSSAPASGKWTDAEVDQKINNRIRRLNRYFKPKDLDSSITSDNSSISYDFPTGVVSIDKIEVWDATTSPDTFEGELVNWKVWQDSGTKKIMLPTAFDGTYTLKLFGYKRLSELSADGDAVDCELESEELLAIGATIDCLRDLYRNRIDMSRYMTEANKKSGSTIDIARALSDYKSEYNEIWTRLKTSKVQRLTFGM